jgi:hypothetical protein
MGRIELLLSDYNSRHELRTPVRMKIPFPFLLPSAIFTSALFSSQSITPGFWHNQT